MTQGDAPESYQTLAIVDKITNPHSSKRN